MRQSIAAVLTVLRKELADALRDRRTLMTVLVSSVLLGPLVLLGVSALVASLESRAEQREIYVAGVEKAPTLQNFLERQTYTVKAPPADYEAQLRRSKFTEPVVVVPDDFESALARGDAPVVEVVSDSANQRSEAATARIERLLDAFGRERAVLNLALRGVAGAAARAGAHRRARPRQPAVAGDAHHRHAALLRHDGGALRRAHRRARHHRRRARARLARAAADEPGRALARSCVGKWGAVACVSMLIAVLSSLSFLPGQWVLRSDTLAAMFQYGVARGAALPRGCCCRSRRRCRRC